MAQITVVLKDNDGSDFKTGQIVMQVSQDEHNQVLHLDEYEFDYSKKVEATYDVFCIKVERAAIALGYDLPRNWYFDEIFSS